LRIILLAIALIFSFPSIKAAEISGIPVISDGDTLKIWTQAIRLEEIDAPDTAQTCTKNDGSVWKCGEASANYLQKITKGKEITCKGSETNQYKRLLATCYMGDINLNQHLIDQGWAVAYIEYFATYLSDERNAQQQNKGI
jgi:endonuclease YncB( thermonuclease family)